MNSTSDQLFNNAKAGASWEGFALEETIRCSQATYSECFFWSTYSDAELDLLIMKYGKKLGFEFKYTDNPKVTKSMHIAINDLNLDHIFIIVPIDDYYLLDKKITVCGINKIEHAFKQIEIN
jgi:uncharacterized protein